MSRRPAAWSGAWLLWAGVVAAAPADDSAERARIASDRQAMEARYDAARRDCETRFVVNDCLDQARQARRAALEPLQPIFLLVAVASFAFAYRRLYRAEPGCAPGDACVVPQVRRRQRTVFWLASMVVASLVTFPWYAGLLY